MPSTAENYLFDAMPELIERAGEARDDARSKGKGDESAAGRALAYYEVVSYLVQQLDAFGIDCASVRVDPKFDVDRDLL